jgi:serine/threonine protein kinase
MVMEYCPYSSLETHFVDRESFTFSWPLRIKIAYDVARGLATLHKQHIIHRDIRSPNIFVRWNSIVFFFTFRSALFFSPSSDVEIYSLDIEGEGVNAKIGDFGLAQHTLPHLKEILCSWQVRFGV